MNKDMISRAEAIKAVCAKTDGNNYAVVEYALEIVEAIAALPAEEENDESVQSLH